MDPHMRFLHALSILLSCNLTNSQCTIPSNHILSPPHTLSHFCFFPSQILYRSFFFICRNEVERILQPCVHVLPTSTSYGSTIANTKKASFVDPQTRWIWNQMLYIHINMHQLLHSHVLLLFEVN